MTSFVTAPIVLFEETKMRLLLNWVLSAVAVWVVAQVVPSMISVSGARSALIAALVIGFINATIGAVLKILTFPLTVLTLGLFWLVINALMLELASALLSPGFQVHGFLAAFVGAIVLSLVNLALKAIVMPSKDQR
jgi:putative membrane protein